jgi:hypothetical protein
MQILAHLTELTPDPADAGEYVQPMPRHRYNFHLSKREVTKLIYVTGHRLNYTVRVNGFGDLDDFNTPSSGLGQLHRLVTARDSPREPRIVPSRRSYNPHTPKEPGRNA